MEGRRAILCGAIALAIANLVTVNIAAAGDAFDMANRYTLWVPDDWSVEKRTGGVVARDTANKIHVTTGLAPTGLSLDSRAIQDFVDDMLGPTTIVSDVRARHGSNDARLLTGAGFDKGTREAVEFEALVVDPGGGQPLIEMVIYGKQKDLRPKHARELVKKIERSLTPR